MPVSKKKSNTSEVTTSNPQSLTPLPSQQEFQQVLQQETCKVLRVFLQDVYCSPGAAPFQFVLLLDHPRW
ncbi:hypothetical protein [Candidatus Chlorohelix sp.]|uniref:hypothetical protein n=1 Tax=Candidatus Chlorohelix sp. TaxID=3139201 RepID=UPI00305EF346